MNPEVLMVYQATAGLAGATTASMMYGLGGRSDKWKRRWVAGFILAATVNGLCLWTSKWNPWMLVTFPVIVAGLHLGYSDKNKGGWVKFGRRLIYALGNVTAGLLMAVILGGHAWSILVIHVGVAVWSVWLGYRNNLWAAAEEVFICMLLNIMLVAYPFIR